VTDTPTPVPPKKRLQKLRALLRRYRKLLWATAGLILAAFLGAGWWLLRNLPSLAELDNLQAKVPLRVFSDDGILIGEFGKERRSLVKLAEMPAQLKHAVLAIEDARFYEHGAVDLQGVLRAGLANLGSGGRGQGASTITMQLARNMFLTKDKTYTRKLREILLAYKIESVRSKDEVLELYMNQIYLGQRAYGYASAARIYYGKELKDITLAEAAMLAGLPKAPAAYNPVVNPKRARIRQAYILKRMLELKLIDKASYEQALAEPLKLAEGEMQTYQPRPKAEYAAEMARQQMVAQYGEKAYGMGLVVHTTINYTAQLAAWDAVRTSLLDYDRRRNYRGPEGLVALPTADDDRNDAIEEALETHPDAEEMIAAVVLKASPREVTVQTREGETLVINGNGLRFAAAGLRSSANDALRIKPGSIVRVIQNTQGKPEIAQLPEVQGALVALAPQDGAIRALVGGFDFKVQHFNRAAQAWRQPGSTFKPFVYSAALERGVGPATIVNDAPLSIKLDPKDEKAWEPKNDDYSQSGPITLRRGLQKSKNLVAVRVLDYIGVPYARDYVTRFGFERRQVPPYLPMALGAGQVTPLQLARGYTVFANGGFRVDPYLIREVRDGKGKLLLQAQPKIADQNAIRAISPRNAFLMNNLLQGVAQHGTAYRSNDMGRTDLAGKTGTTNEARDAWFAGYHNSLVAVSWMGFDQPRSLGTSSAGSQLALPQWMRFMTPMLKGLPTYTMPQPAGVSQHGGEWYFDEFTRGNGFVAGIGMRGVAMPEPEEEAELLEGEEIPTEEGEPEETSEPTPDGTQSGKRDR